MTAQRSVAPKGVEEWAKECEEQAHGWKSQHEQVPIFVICSDCARAYAQEQVAAEREACAVLAEGLVITIDGLSQRAKDGHWVAVAIRVRE